MMNSNAPIGIFDSGVGGLTVVREIMRQIPNERIVYFGDTARVPYGSKSKETVTKYSRQIVRFLKTQNVKAIVIACNTASAYALEQIEKEIAHRDYLDMNKGYGSLKKAEDAIELDTSDMSIEEVVNFIYNKALELM